MNYEALIGVGLSKGRTLDKLSHQQYLASRFAGKLKPGGIYKTSCTRRPAASGIRMTFGVIFASESKAEPKRSGSRPINE